MTYSVRTRLIIALLALSVLPLTAVTLLSYRASVNAFERAAEREATDDAVDVTRRMDIVTADLGERMDRMFVAAASNPDPDPNPDPARIRAAMMPILGDTAALIDRVEFEADADVEDVPHTPRTARVPGVAAVPPPAAPAPPGAAPPRPAAPPAPPKVIVVDMPKLMAEATKGAREGMSHIDPNLARLIEQSMVVGMTSAAEAMKAGAADREAAIAAARTAKRLQMDMQGKQLQLVVRKDGKPVGKANATLNLDRTLHAVLAFSQREAGELPFALDRSGKLYTPNAADLTRLQALGVEQIAPRAADGSPARSDDWLIVAKRDSSGIIFGIARPLGESLREIRTASVRNLGLGLGVIALAFIGVIPISHRMTQHLSSLTAGVRQLAAGDFHTRVAVETTDEFGTLATAFNQMAADLERQQSLVVQQEGLRRELELSRQIQTEMLPRTPLRSEAAEIAGISVPAREVGGDFFNYFDLPDGRLALLVGDVSGKGVSAALLMANAQATLRARLPLEFDLAKLADSFDRELDRNTPRSVYLTLFIGILEEHGRVLRYVNAGHNPQFLIRRRGGIEPLSSTGLPIALYAGHGYFEAKVTVEPGDLLFFYTDGLVEAEDAAGEMFGAERLQQLLAEAQARDLASILSLVEARVRTFRGEVEPLDDATMMALRVTAPSLDRSPA
jgi:serine phosphatase RsbU (regulator of sigma subunit)